MESYMKEGTVHGADISAHLSDIMMKVYDELDGAKEYINAAISHKAVDETLANNLCNMSAQELQHAEILMNSITSTLKDMKDGACYDTLSIVWEHVKERQMGYAAWIRQMHAQYKK